ncbi:MAG: NAD(+) synthase [Lachnospiraceae bacterium]|nr:NAD(+) synthase [Lachnospiraceae bacterium]
MKDGFVRVAAVTPKIRVADPEFNAGQIIEQIELASSEGAKIIVFPELSLSGYTCGDLFLHDTLVKECRIWLKAIADATTAYDSLIFVGLPYSYGGKLYNAAACLHRGLVLGLIPKTNLPNYSEFYEERHFTPGFGRPVFTDFFGLDIPFGTDIIFENGKSDERIRVACEICEDLWVADAPSVRHAAAGANVIVNLSASDMLVGKGDYREKLVVNASARYSAAYIYANAGEGESTQDLVFAGHDLIAENGTKLAQLKPFETGYVTADIDIDALASERSRMNTFLSGDDPDYVYVPFLIDETQILINRAFPRLPFVPSDIFEREKRCEEIFNIQAYGLKKRLEHTGVKDVVIGLSGGLDSTLALLVAFRTFRLLKLPASGIHTVTMPCFGTTDRTRSNAVELAEALGTDLSVIDIKNAVKVHMADIGQSEDVHDVTYENCQARERTQVLMDLANMKNALVVGTGDMSELALGWATYNGDHMSMYDVNAGVPKTLVRHLVKYAEDNTRSEGNSAAADILADILDTPVSPELLPAKDGVISQKTEEIVGPYELHDFFLYYFLRFGFGPKKIFFMAVAAFEGSYDRETVKKWLAVFIRRFFSQQFKRSCLPDGPKVGTVGISPRGDLRMPSDAAVTLWLKEMEEID